MISGTFISKPARISALIVDSDLDLAAYKLKTDHIAESTASHTIIADNTVQAETVKADHIAEKTASHTIIADNTVQAAMVKADHIAEKTASHTIVADNTFNATLAALKPLTGIQEVSASRAKDTAYQNTSGGLMLVTIVYQDTTAQSGELDLYVSSDGATWVWVSFQHDTHSDGSYDWTAVHCFVPNGWYYKLVEIGTILHEYKWYEYY